MMKKSPPLPLPLLTRRTQWLKDQRQKAISSAISTCRRQTTAGPTSSPTSSESGSLVTSWSDVRSVFSTTTSPFPSSPFCRHGGPQSSDGADDEGQGVRDVLEFATALLGCTPQNCRELSLQEEELTMVVDGHIAGLRLPSLNDQQGDRRGAPTMVMNVVGAGDPAVQRYQCVATLYGLLLAELVALRQLLQTTRSRTVGTRSRRVPTAVHDDGMELLLEALAVKAAEYLRSEGALSSFLFLSSSVEGGGQVALGYHSHSVGNAATEESDWVALERKVAAGLSGALAGRVDETCNTHHGGTPDDDHGRSCTQVNERRVKERLFSKHILEEGHTAGSSVLSVVDRLKKSSRSSDSGFPRALQATEGQHRCTMPRLFVDLQDQRMSEAQLKALNEQLSSIGTQSSEQTVI